MRKKPESCMIKLIVFEYFDRNILISEGIYQNTSEWRLDMFERRKAKRLDLKADIIMNRLDSSETKMVEIEVLDISKTGMGFICVEALDMGAVYETDITIWTGDTIHAFVEIVRIQKMEGGSIYGGSFVGMPESDWCRIRVYETYQEFAPDQA